MTRDHLVLATFIAGVLVTGILIGTGFPPGPWYAGLTKPWFTPPNWVFGPAWSLLYILIGIAGWRVWLRGQDPVLRRLWIAQMVLNFAWSPAFFGAQAPLLGLAVILPLLMVSLGFVRRAYRHEPTSARLFLPYAAWVCYASLLNAALYLLN